MTTSMDSQQAKALVDEHYRKVANRWQERVTDGSFMKQLRAGKLTEKALKIFFQNWGSYTIEINTLEAASYHKHISFFRKHRDLMAPMAAKLADELIHPKPPGHVHVVVETARALGITEDEIFLSPMLAEFRAKLDFKRSILWEGTIGEFYAAGATEEQTGYWSAEFFKALTAHHGLTREQAVYFSTHEEADLEDHEGVMGHGSFRRLVLQRLFEDGMAIARPGYSLEYCGLTAVDLHGVCLQAALEAAGRKSQRKQSIIRKTRAASSSAAMGAAEQLDG
jgi:pyrroloquinoline quinone (PQQ) biosynthesis protein C